MSWKNVKQHYRIGHTVQVTKEGICIGSPYIHNLLVIGLDGTVKKRYTDNRTNEDLARYQAEMDADPVTLKHLVLLPHTAKASIPVFTYDGARIIEKYCEVLGWPNVTHDGLMMYENTFSTDRTQVIQWAKRNAELGVEMWRENVDRRADELAEARGNLAAEQSVLAKLLADYP